MSKKAWMSGAILPMILTCLEPGDAAGAGFAILQQGTGPMGQGNAFVAQADDPSAVFFNPAGITQIDGSEAYLGTTFIAPRITYDGENGDFEDTVSKLYATPHLYLTHKLTQNVSLGLGVFSPFGLGTVWHDDWEGRYITTYSSLTTAAINPNVAVRMGKFSLALGIDVLGADLELKKRLRTPFGDGRQELTDKTWGYGCNVGILFDASDTVRLGLSYRSEIDLDFDDADADFDVPVLLAGFFPDTGAEGELTLPPSLTAGVSFNPRPDLTVEFDLTWTGWSSYDELKVAFDDPVGPSAVSISRQPKEWEDVLAYRFGVRYNLDKRNTLRFGFIYDENPVPDDTFGPDLPDADRLVYTAGYDLMLNDRLTLGCAYNYIDGKKRNKDNAVLPELPDLYKAQGLYEQTIHSVGLSVKYAF